MSIKKYEIIVKFAIVINEVIDNLCYGIDENELRPDKTIKLLLPVLADLITDEFKFNEVVSFFYFNKLNLSKKKLNLEVCRGLSRVSRGRKMEAVDAFQNIF